MRFATGDQQKLRQGLRLAAAKRSATGKPAEHLEARVSALHRRNELHFFLVAGTPRSASPPGQGHAAGSFWRPARGLVGRLLSAAAAQNPASANCSNSASSKPASGEGLKVGSWPASGSESGRRRTSRSCAATSAAGRRSSWRQCGRKSRTPEDWRRCRSSGGDPWA